MSWTPRPCRSGANRCVSSSANPAGSRRHRSRRVLLAELPHPAQVGLPRELLVAVVGVVGCKAERRRDRGNELGDVRASRPAQPGEYRPRSGATEEGAVAHLVGDARRGERLFEGLRASVDPREDRDLVPRGALVVEAARLRGDERDLGRLIGERPRRGRRSVGLGGAQLFAEAAEVVGQGVSHGEDLRRGPVVALERRDDRVGEPLRERRRCSGEAPVKE